MGEASPLPIAFLVPHKARSALLWQLATFLKSLATRPGLPFRRRPGPATSPYNESRAIIQLNPAKRRVAFCQAARPPFCLTTAVSDAVDGSSTGT